MVGRDGAGVRLPAGPIVRVTGRNTPIPFADSIEKGVWPDTRDVIDAIRASVSGRAPGA